MKSPARRISMVGCVVCPRCEIGQLSVEGPTREVARCSFCGRATDWELFDCLLQVAALPGAAGSHVCECGHPEMRPLPDGVFWCPSCGSEVLPFEPDPSSPAAGA